MITINNHKFAKNDTEFTDTLFTADGTAYGYYKKLKNRVIFMDMQKTPFAALVRNKSGSFLVNHTVIDGKPFYQHGLSSNHERLFGIPDGYIASLEYVDSLADKLI